MVSTAIATEVTGAVTGRLVGALAAAFGLRPAASDVENIENAGVRRAGEERRTSDMVIVDPLLTRC